MAQEINKVGTIEKLTETPVVFISRTLSYINVIDDQKVIIDFENKSNEGSSFEKIEIDYSAFKSIEDRIWALVDNTKSSVEEG
ncbi:hypothetical protein [Enterococcus gallinarum]|uniref:hypothetical protein n=1 Tax=Enterococcus gallinarum TaxID=1353 RepID=UPI00115759F6|nr:hypothetical protein [Enterococcus gallinarum]